MDTGTGKHNKEPRKLELLSLETYITLTTSRNLEMQLITWEFLFLTLESCAFVFKIRPSSLTRR